MASRKRPKSEIVSPGLMAAVYARAGDRDSAFKGLDKAYAKHDGAEITLLKCDPSYKNPGGDPRFTDLLRRMGLPE